MILIDSIKRRLHRDIVADPILHARVLNLYLCGEAYPHAVDDYFPVDDVDCPDLAARMREHRADEDRHITLYAKTIARLGAEVIDLPSGCIFNHVIRKHTLEPWKIESSASGDTKRDRIANFLAHAHCLEKRVARSLEFHIEACAHSPHDFPGKAVASVLSDEIKHVHYTKEAVFDLVPRQRALDIMNQHHAAEHRANLDFSSSQLRRLIGEESNRWPTARKHFYELCSHFMRGILAYA